MFRFTSFFLVPILFAVSPIPATSVSDLVQEGELSEGIHYLLTRDNTREGSILMEVVLPNGRGNETDETLGFSDWIRGALLWGSESMDRNELLALCEQIEVDPDVLIEVKEESIRFSLTLPPEKRMHFSDAVGLLSEIALHATPSEEALEIERCRLIERLNQDQIEIKANLLGAVPSEVVGYYQTLVHPHPSQSRPTPVIIHISGDFSFDDVKQALIHPNQQIALESMDIQPWNNQNKPFEPIIAHLRSLQSESIHVGNQTYHLVDENILMKNPSPLKKQKVGRLAGSVLFILSVLTFFASLIVIATGGSAIPILIIPLSIFGIVGGGKMVSMPYFNDPQYVQSARIEDLSSSFTTVYRNDHFRWTLSPSESRSLFIYEHLYNPDISTIHSSYDLYQPDLVHLFVHEEIHVLRYLKREYQTEKVKLDRIRDEIDQMMQSALTGARQRRDAKLEQTKLAYDQSYYVVRERQLRTQKEEAIRQYKENARLALEELEENASELTLEEMKEEKEKIEEILEYNIRNIEGWYEQQMTDEIRAGYEAAKQILRENQDQINREYEDEVKKIKRDMGYNEAMREYKERIAELNKHFNEQLRNALQEFDLNSKEIPDFRVQPGIKPDDFDELGIF